LTGGERPPPAPRKPRILSVVEVKELLRRASDDFITTTTKKTAGGHTKTTIHIHRKTPIEDIEQQRKLARLAKHVKRLRLKLRHPSTNR
jgi:hypothetical protein